MKRIVFKTKDQLHIFRLGNTTNKKICENSKEKIVQTYVFSFDQFQYVSDGGKSLKDFFAEGADGEDIGRRPRNVPEERDLRVVSGIVHC